MKKQKLFLFNHLAISFILFICTNLVAADVSDPIYKILRESFDASRNISYSCTVTDKELLEGYWAVSGKYTQLILNNGLVCKNMELFDNTQKLVVRFCQNRDGSFAFAANKWGKIAEILPLRHFDQMCEDFDEFELSLATFSKRIIQYNGQNCIEITMTTRPDAKAIRWGGNPEIPIFSISGIDDINSRAYAIRPMKRIFIIDPQNSLLLSREHYNLKNQLLYRRKLVDVELNISLEEDDFNPTGKIVGDYLLLNSQFMAKYYNEMYQKNMPKNIKSDTTYYEPSILERLDSWLFDSGRDVAIVWILRIGGIVCLVVIGIVCWRKRKQ